MMTRVPAIMWSNGHIQTAATWDALLEVVRLSQVRHIDPTTFRSELAHRAWVWDGYLVNTDGDAYTLFRDLEHAKLLKIIDANTTTKKEI